MLRHGLDAFLRPVPTVRCIARRNRRTRGLHRGEALQRWRVVVMDLGLADARDWVEEFVCRPTALVTWVVGIAAWCPVCSPEDGEEFALQAGEIVDDWSAAPALGDCTLVVREAVLLDQNVDCRLLEGEHA